MSINIRIPSLKYLPEVVTELEQLNFNYDVELNIVVDRWSDELDLDNQSPPKGLMDQLKAEGLIKPVSSLQMEQLRKHLRGE